jgi:hypothetical protein
MPVEADVDPGGSFATLTITDPYTFDEWRATMDDVLASVVYAATSAVLVDRRRATAPSMDFVERIIRFFAERRPQLRHARAAIIADEALTYGMSRMLELKSQMLVPAVTIRVFRDYSTASRWLRGPRRKG